MSKIKTILKRRARKKLIWSNVKELPCVINNSTMAVLVIKGDTTIIRFRGV